MTRKFIVILSILWIVMLLTSCAGDVPQGETHENDIYEVEPPFREFYEQLGGKDIMGPAISPVFVSGYVKYQYSRAGLFVYDPQMADLRNFSLAPIGLDLSIKEPPEPQPENDSERYVGGHIIPPEFIEMYERLGGVSIVGSPITGVHYNPTNKRMEQYFENLGFYLLEDQPSTGVGLLAYGSWKCGESCGENLQSQDNILLPTETNKVFQEAVKRLGINFTGFALTEAYISPEGRIEQIFENIVLYTDPDHPGKVFLRPISEKLGILPEPMVSPNFDSEMNFYPVQGEKGYNIPGYFLDYLAFHGGIEVSGSPISELVRKDEYVYRQCFLNLCLEDHRNLSKSIRIRPAPLGYSYRDLVGKGLPEEDSPSNTTTPDLNIRTPVFTPLLEQPTQVSDSSPEIIQEINIKVTKIYPIVNPGQSQEIGVNVYKNTLPMGGVRPEITIWLPDGEVKSYEMGQTGDDGYTRIKIDSVNAPTGTLIPFEVCIDNSSEGRVCVEDTYLIWSELE